MTYAFHEFKIPRLISLIHPDNRASISVAEKLGETFERAMNFNGRTILVYGRDNPAENAQLEC
jgi:RimJ/RimL family protein N-acetyltransferase